MCCLARAEARTAHLVLLSSGLVFLRGSVSLGTYRLCVLSSF